MVHAFGGAAHITPQSYVASYAGTCIYSFTHTHTYYVWTDTGQTQDRHRTDTGQTQDRHRTDTGQTQDRHRRARWPARGGPCTAVAARRSLHGGRCAVVLARRSAGGGAGGRAAGGGVVHGALGFANLHGVTGIETGNRTRLVFNIELLLCKNSPSVW